MPSFLNTQPRSNTYSLLNFTQLDSAVCSDALTTCPFPLNFKSSFDKHPLMFLAESLRSPDSPLLRWLKASLKLPNTLWDQMFNQLWLVHETLMGEFSKGLSKIQNHHFCTIITEESHQKGLVPSAVNGAAQCFPMALSFLSYKYCREHLPFPLALQFLKFEGFASERDLMGMRNPTCL